MRGGQAVVSEHFHVVVGNSEQIKVGVEYLQSNILVVEMSRIGQLLK